MRPKDTMQDFEEDEPYGNNEAQIHVVKLPESAYGERIDKVLARVLSQYSRSRLQHWIEVGHVTIMGEPVGVRTIVLGGEVVKVCVQTAPEDAAYLPEFMDLQILFEDDQIIVLNKPAGLVVHPASGNWSGTLLNGLLSHCPILLTIPRAGIVHRLDKDTSGLMVVAKTLEAHTDLVRQLQARSVMREYWALVWGAPHLSGTINCPMTRHPRDRLKMAVSGSPNAKPAITHYQRIANGILADQTISLMCCKLETGRTHQIRVHMHSLGFPLVGDPVYGKHHLASVFPRQALHAYKLGLLHPESGVFSQWHCPLPADYSELLSVAEITLKEEL